MSRGFLDYLKNGIHVYPCLKKLVNGTTTNYLGTPERDACVCVCVCVCVRVCVWGGGGTGCGGVCIFHIPFV